MPKSWNDYAKKATTAETGGDFPDIDDGLYNAIIQDVSDMIEDEGNGRFGPSTKFYVTWEFENQDGETVSRRQYIKVADGFLDHHNIHPKSALHKFMSGLGFDMTPPEVEVDPPSWQGMEAKILIENKAPEGGGEVRPQVVKVMPAKKAKAAAAAGAKASAKKGGDDSDLPFE